MTASSQAEQNAQPAMAGFKAHAAQRKPQQPQQAGLVSKGRAKGAPAQSDVNTAAPLHSQFNHAEFLALLAKLYGVAEIEKDLAAALEGFKPDASKGPQTLENGVLYAQYGADAVEITTSSVLSDAKITPELAYKMAAAAAANPHVGKLSLEGSDEDKIMLLLAARHLGLEIEENSIPEAPKNMASLVQTFQKYEQEKGLKPITTEYLNPPQPQTKPKPAAAQAPLFHGMAPA